MTEHWTQIQLGLFLIVVLFVDLYTAMARALTHSLTFALNSVGQLVLSSDTKAPASEQPIPTLYLRVLGSRPLAGVSPQQPYVSRS